MLYSGGSIIINERCIMINLKKTLSLMCVFGVLTTSVTTHAVTDKVWNTESFTKAWESTVYGGNFSYTYGYNTTWINEDYTHSIHDVWSHQAAVANGNTAHESSVTKAGKVAKVEIRHYGNDVLYGIIY